MKKPIAILLLWLFALMAFAQGTHDLSPFPKDLQLLDSSGNIKLFCSAKETHQLGVAHLNLVFTQFSHIFYRLDNELFDADSNLINDNFLLSLEPSGFSEQSCVLPLNIGDDEIIDIEIPVFERIIDLSSHLDILKSGSIANIEIPEDRTKKDIDIFLYDETQKKLVVINRDEFPCEFFTGEIDFFETYASAADPILDAIALSYAGRRLRDEQSAEGYKAIYEYAEISGIPWEHYVNLMESGHSDEVTGAFLRMYLSVNTNLREKQTDPASDLYYASFSQGEFRLLYGDHPNPYVTSYLMTLPVFVTSLFYEENIAVLQNQGVAYSPRYYWNIDEEAGEIIAKNAQKYLHSGVEYTLFHDYDIEIQPVFSANKSFIEDWVNNNQGNRSRSNNFLPESASWPETWNPIPYTPGGLDTPRTFNYKMYQQYISNPSNQRNTTLAFYYNRVDFLNGYRNETEVIFDLTDVSSTFSSETGKIVPYQRYVFQEKPFLPGYISDTILRGEESYDSLFCLDKMAGVDSSGLLLGSISMGNPSQNAFFAGFSNRNNRNNRNIGQYMNTWNQMQTSLVRGALVEDPESTETFYGLDDSGSPAFYPYLMNGETNSISDNSCLFLTRGDIERNSTLILDLYDIRPGDILVSDTDANGRMEIAIVTENQNLYSNTVEEKMNGIHFVTVNKRTGRVVEGRWLDGISLNRDPFSFQPRRLAFYEYVED